MLRKTPTTERMSVGDSGDGEVRERTQSYGAKLQKQKSKRQVEQKTCEERLQEMYLKIPAKIDAAVLEATIKEGEGLGVAKDFLDRCRVTLGDAQKLAAKKREEERLQKLAFRCEQVSKKLQLLIKAQPLEADLPGLKEALDETNALEEEPGPHKVEESLSMASRQFLEAAEKAFAERQRAAEAALRDQMRCPLLVDPESLRSACEVAKVAKADRPLLAKASNLLKDAERRNAAASKLARLCEVPEDEEVQGNILDPVDHPKVLPAVPQRILVLVFFFFFFIVIGFVVIGFVVILVVVQGHH